MSKHVVQINGLKRKKSVLIPMHMQTRTNGGALALKISAHEFDYAQLGMIANTVEEGSREVQSTQMQHF